MAGDDQVSEDENESRANQEFAYFPRPVKPVDVRKPRLSLHRIRLLPVQENLSVDHGEDEALPDVLQLGPRLGDDALEQEVVSHV